MISEERSYEFANVNAASNAETEFAIGREPIDTSRPATTSRAGFMESIGCGVHGVMSAKTTLEFGGPFAVPSRSPQLPPITPVALCLSLERVLSPSPTRSLPSPSSMPSIIASRSASGSSISMLERSPSASPKAETSTRSTLRSALLPRRRLPSRKGCHCHVRCAWRLRSPDRCLRRALAGVSRQTKLECSRFTLPEPWNDIFPSISRTTFLAWLR